MPIYDRIKLEITDISPESASKVFQFINALLEEHSLDVNHFKKNIGNYTIDQQYFIFFFAKQYFSCSNQSYLNKWLAHHNHQLGEGEHTEKLLDYTNNIINGAEKILDYINVNERTTERQSKAFKKNNIYLYVTSSPINYKIPLYFKVKSDKERRILENLSDKEINKESFKNNVREILLGVVQGKEFEIFFNNSFDYQGNIYPLEALNLEFENSSLVYSKFHKLYKYYFNERNKQNKIVNEYYQKVFKEIKNNISKSKDPKNKLSDTRKKFMLQKKAPNIESVGRFEFMKIMYNSFPQIRESYLIYQQKHPSTTIDAYLKTKSRNIK